MVIELYYHPQSPPSGAIRMLLREIGLEFNEHVIDFFGGQHKSDDYKKINPHMQLPTLVDGGSFFYESRAIAIYLCEKYDKTKLLYPSDVVQVAKMNAMLFRDVDNFKAMLQLSNVGAILLGKACGPFEALLPKRHAVLSEYDALVADQKYMFGNHLTILDMFVTGTLIEIAVTGFDGWHEYSNLNKWKARMKELAYLEDVITKPLKLSIAMYKAACEKNASAPGSDK